MLFGTRGSIRTADAGRSQVNVIASRKRGHSIKPDELYDIIEDCSYGPYSELFARNPRKGWVQWGNEIEQETRNPQEPSLARKKPLANLAVA